jgi:hypothetical protein
MTLEELAGHVPLFMKQTVAVVSGPKRFIGALDLKSTDTLRSALIYYALALAISLGLELPFAGEAAKFSDRLPTAVLVLVVGLTLSNAFLTASLRLFGGNRSYLENLVVTLYVWGVGVLIWAAGAFITKGMMFVTVPALFATYLEYMELLLAGSTAVGDARFKPLLETDIIVVSMLFFATVQLVLITWFLFTWGVYRFINHLKAGRAALALVFFLMGFYPLTKMLLAAQLGAGVRLF